MITLEAIYENEVQNLALISEGMTVSSLCEVAHFSGERQELFPLLHYMSYPLLPTERRPAPRQENVSPGGID